MCAIYWVVRFRMRLTCVLLLHISTIIVMRINSLILCNDEAPQWVLNKSSIILELPVMWWLTIFMLCCVCTWPYSLARPRLCPMPYNITIIPRRGNHFIQPGQTTYICLRSRCLPEYINAHVCVFTHDLSALTQTHITCDREGALGTFYSQTHTHSSRMHEFLSIYHLYIFSLYTYAIVLPSYIYFGAI